MNEQTGNHKRAVIFSVVVLVIMALAVLVVSLAPKPVLDFSSYPAGFQRKQAFVQYFLPLIKKENDRIIEHRLKLLALRDKDALGYFDQNWLDELAKKYRLNDFDPGNELDWIELIRRVDTMPPSLALAQSANESAWGTSRFSRRGNNYFGQWCFFQGCGLVPAARSKGATHEVQVFSSPQESVATYIRNLNTHKAYSELRDIRAELRFRKMATSGIDLAEGLLAYSERGFDYVLELQQMIRYNGWGEFDLVL